LDYLLDYPNISTYAQAVKVGRGYKKRAREKDEIGLSPEEG
jgi:hypothetical protein